MAKKTAYYTITNGLAGCYMPDHNSGPVFATSRKMLADIIRYEIERLDWPASMFKEVKIRRLWSFIARNGSSVAHFGLQREGYELAFHGLTEDEFNAAVKEQDC